MPYDRDQLLTMDDARLSALCRLDFFKATGNGGQKRNKTSSAVRVTLPEYDLAVTDCSERSQHRNRAAALAKLRWLLALKLRKAYTPFAREACSPEHSDYPLFVAKLLDLLAEQTWDYRAAAGIFGCSGTQMLKLLARSPEVLALCNRERAKLQLPEIHP